MSSLKFRAPARDEKVAAFLAAVGLLASYIPARRAMEVDPIKALNHE